MHLKNIILFFCVTLNFLHGQGATSKELVNWARDEVARTVGQNVLNFKKLQTLFNHVADTCELYTTLDKNEELQIDLFTKQQVESYARKIVCSDDPDVLKNIRSVVNIHDDKEDGTYSYEQVRKVVDDLKIEYEGITGEYPSDEEIKELRYNVIYTPKDVERIIINNLFPNV
ncbi:uncharacterized protein LOC126841512 [Adelges cooleyi]|uniref:uncharacterized protein LOC126841512 n=1 Tax=Adelges cooleyi TaxID=133065 RepID=UPI00217F6CE0|nr:uncharacterized protein LOC126841512 [Adelges cooleyi]